MINLDEARANLISAVGKSCPGPHNPEPFCDSCGRSAYGKKAKKHGRRADVQSQR